MAKSKIQRNQIWFTLDSTGYFDTSVRVVRAPRNGRVLCVQQGLNGGDVYGRINLPVSEFVRQTGTVAS